MDNVICSEMKRGRHFIGRLPHGKDLIASVEAFCEKNEIQMGTFSIIGALSSMTIGAYDQKQQVYVTFKKEMEFEIVSCIGNISLKDGKPFVHAHIILGDGKGETTGGHLFSESIVFAGEIDILEFSGKPFERMHDQTTGLMLWHM